MSLTAVSRLARLMICALVLALATGCATTAPAPCDCKRAATPAADAKVVEAAPAPTTEIVEVDDIKPVMRELLVDLAALQETLGFDNSAQAHGHAVRMSQTWAGAAHGEKAPKDRGSLYYALRVQLADGLKGLTEAASAGNLRQARGHYATVVGTCVACHAQSKAAAGRVWLGRLIMGAGTR